jgi:hypothetical protein
MDNLVSINRKKILGDYIDAQDSEHIPEDAYFCAGVFLSVLLPQYTFYVYGGFLPLIAFTVCALAGAAFGLARYWSPYTPLSCVATDTEEQVPPREDTSSKRAA